MSQQHGPPHTSATLMYYNTMPHSGAYYPHGPSQQDDTMPHSGAYYPHGPSQQDYPVMQKGKTSSAGVHLVRNIFVVAGTTMLTMLCAVPLWNAFALMSDVNYVFWVGRNVPAIMVVVCLGIVLLYIITVYTFFTYARESLQNESNVMMIANIFLTMLGLLLMLASLPLSSQASSTYTNLMHNCDTSEQTQRTYEYAQVLQNMRQTSACMEMVSVEECEGFENSWPYTVYLKAMEESFRCSGFCYKSAASFASVGIAGGVAAAPAAVANASAPQGGNGTSLLSLTHRVAERPQAVRRPLAGPNAYVPGSRYPPTLFSQANFRAACDETAARDMKNFAGDVGYQCFYQGIYLVLIAITTSFLKLVGLCTRKDDEDSARWAT